MLEFDLSRCFRTDGAESLSCIGWKDVNERNSERAAVPCMLYAPAGWALALVRMTTLRYQLLPKRGSRAFLKVSKKSVS